MMATMVLLLVLAVVIASWARRSRRLALAGVAAAALVLAGCEFAGSVGDDEPLEIGNAVAALGVDGDDRPVDVSEVFDVGTPEIVVVVPVRGVAEDTVLASEWVHEGATVFAEVDLDLPEGRSRPNLSVTRPDDGWPVGDYVVDLEVAGPDGERVTEQVAFRVEGEPAVEEPEEELAEEAEEVVEEAVPEDDPDGSELSSLERAEGLPADVPLPSEPGRVLPISEEDGDLLFGFQVIADHTDIVAFYDEALEEEGWSTIMREDDWEQDDDSVFWFVSKGDLHMVVVVGPDEDTPDWTLIAIEVDPDFEP